MSKSAWIHIIFDNACSTLGLWLDKIGGSEIFLILIPYLGPLVHSGAARPAAVTFMTYRTAFAAKKWEIPFKSGQKKKRILPFSSHFLAYMEP